MGKRSSFERIPRDAYDTPRDAVLPLLAHLQLATQFVEPCAGKGALIDTLERAGHRCVYACDIAPRRKDIEKRDALTLTHADIPEGAKIITNTPHERRVLHAMIEHFTKLAPTWLLIDANWINTMQSAPFVARLQIYQPIGRVIWIPGTTMNGKDDAAWFLFGRQSRGWFKGYGRIPRGMMPKLET
jgi:hypothetical protein